MVVVDVLMCEATVSKWSRDRIVLYVPVDIQEKLREYGVKRVKLIIFICRLPIKEEKK